MKILKKVSAVLFFANILALFGIVGGIECGEPFSNAVWLIPCGVMIFVFGKISKIID